MPAPQNDLMSKMAKVFFAMNFIQLPMDWKDMGDLYMDAFEIDEKMVPPNPPPPINLFKEVSLNKYHVDTAKTISDGFSDYIDGICGAICDGIDKWLKTTTIVGVIINGPVGVLAPGNVIGATPLNMLIFATAPKNTPQEMKYSNAIASAFGTLWQAWSAGIAGILSYPPLAAFPGPVAPPTPNVPIPLIALPSPGEPGLSPGSLKGMMIVNLAEPTAYHASELFDAITKAFNAVFQIFKASTLVKNVLGTGPIPTFAPPFMPAGPVMGGIGIGAPGCIS
jgi:hypothetical protein